jgi:hypothetical protein
MPAPFSTDILIRPEPALSASSDAPDIAPIGPPLSAEVNKPTAAPAQPQQPAAQPADPDAVLAAAQTRLQQLRSVPIAQPEAVDPGPRPSRYDFDGPDAYDDALDDWRERRTQARFDAKLAEREQQKRNVEIAEVERVYNGALTAKHAEAAAKFQARVAEYKQANPDAIPDSLFERNDIYISVPMAQVIMGDEKGPEILDYFAQHPEESTRIAGLTVPGHQAGGEPVPDPARQMYEMALIRTKIAESPPATRRATPAPAQPRDASGRYVSSGNASTGREESMQEYGARRTAEIIAQRFPALAARR